MWKWTTEIQDDSNSSSLPHLSPFITSTKCTSLFSLKFLERSGRMAEWSMPPSVATLPTQLLSWSLSHRDDWLTVTRSSHWGLNRPFRVLGLRPTGYCAKEAELSQKSHSFGIQTALDQFKKMICSGIGRLCCRVLNLQNKNKEMQITKSSSSKLSFVQKQTKLAILYNSDWPVQKNHSFRNQKCHLSVCFWFTKKNRFKRLICSGICSNADKSHLFGNRTTKATLYVYDSFLVLGSNDSLVKELNYIGRAVGFWLIKKSHSSSNH